MGTNYFCYERKSQKIHIGKMSMGWAFVFHGYKEPGFEMSSYSDWEKYLLMRKVKICDDGDERLDVSDFLQSIKQSLSEKKSSLHKDTDSWHDENGFLFLAGYFC